ncbi:MAG TPA: homoserine O-succinyltransferase [Stellaceae bacterium]|nr:homoserine O-succinyltransferase [Stellaceae bacterium]
MCAQLFEPNRRKVLLSDLARPIAVGLINNMPDAALKSTERQFRELLQSAAGNRPLSLRVFSIPGLERSDAARRHVDENHEDIAGLWDAALDGLIVTGAEPRAANLDDEPYWPTLARLIDWAAEHTTATVWSCLAAHAAVYHLDRIERCPRGAKLSGVFDCVRVAEHPLVTLGTARWRTPHSRFNGLSEEALVARGYRILSRAAGAGADIFIKRQKSLFVFLQGHPEYDAGALLREYRRDVGRYLAGERDDYPDMPTGYFDAATADALLGFREQAMRQRDAELLPGFQLLMAEQTVSDPWRPAAVRLFANWLSLLAEGRSAPLGSAAPLVRGRRSRDARAYG